MIRAARWARRLRLHGGWPVDIAVGMALALLAAVYWLGR